jgi:hypothetical protein
MSEVTEHVSYFALRVDPRADADIWWSAVRRRTDAPPAIAALLGGRARVELTREEAGHAMAWAGGIDGWPDTDSKPLIVYPAHALGGPPEREFA